MEFLLQDIRHSLRTWRRQPGFALVAILSLAVGIGVNTAIFSVFDNLLLRPPALQNVERSVVVYHRIPGRDDAGTSYRAFELYRQRTDIFAKSMAFTGARPLVLTDGARRDQVYGEPVTSGFFAMAAIRLRHGGPFPADVDHISGASRIIVLSHAFWSRRFNADPSIVGASVTLNGEPFTVTGIVDEGFTGMSAEVSADMWIPMTTWATLVGEPGRLTGDEHWIRTIAELAPGVSLEQARAAMAIAGRAVAVREGQETTIRAATDILADIPLDAIIIIGAAFAIGLIVLALACTNVANLLLARAAARRHEMAVRLALGSGRARLLRLWVADSLVLSVSAAVCGVVLASWMLSAFVTFQLPTLVGHAEAPLLPRAFHLDVRVSMFALVLTAATALVVGVLSGLQSSRALTLSRINVSRGSDRRFAPGFNLRSGVIALQMALSTILLIPCGAFVRTAFQAADAKPGFEPAGVLLLPISADQSGVKVRKPEGFERDLADRVRRLPGVVGATVMDPVPLWFGGRFAHYAAEGRNYERFGHASVGLQYFETMRIPIVAGRDFDSRDIATAPAVAIVNETTARRLWPGGSAVGQRLHDHDGPVEVVGVARDAKYFSLSEPGQLWLYRPIAQYPSANITLSLAVRTTGDPAGHRTAIEREVIALVPNWPGFQYRMLEEGLQMQQALPRVAATLLGSLGLFGLFLAALGIYGVMAYVVLQRHQELGIRLALGGTVGGVTALVVRQGMIVCVTGAVVGIGLAIGVVQFVSSALYGVGAADLSMFIAVPLILLTVAFLACYLPARDVRRIDRALYRSINRPV